ncbi:alpha/beta hydrolase-fold protein, partial [Faecalibacillus faecis]
MIDQKYRTYPFRECTAIAGSSMGGLMAFYGVIKYNQYIS